MIVGLIQIPDQINSWFLFDNNAENINQTVYQQISYIQTTKNPHMYYRLSSSAAAGGTLIILALSFVFSMPVRAQSPGKYDAAFIENLKNKGKEQLLNYTSTPPY